MIETNYKNLIDHLADKFSIDPIKVYENIPNISLQNRHCISATELLVKDKVYYLMADNTISVPVYKFSNNHIMAKHVGYFKDDTIFIKKN